MKKPQRKCPHCAGTGEVDDPYEIGLRLRLDRQARGLSIEDVAKKMGFTRMYLSHLERGIRNWSDDLISKYRKALK